jgi:hypothetical protein
MKFDQQEINVNKNRPPEMAEEGGGGGGVGTVHIAVKASVRNFLHFD